MIIILTTMMKVIIMQIKNYMVCICKQTDAFANSTSVFVLRRNVTSPLGPEGAKNGRPVVMVA